MRFRVRSTTACAAAFLFAASISSAGAASAAGTSAVATTGAPGTVLNLPTASVYPNGLVIDSRHHHIFVTARQATAPYAAEVLVLNMQGHLVDTIAAGGVGALVLSPDGRTVYASGSPVTAIDTATLRARSLDIGADYNMSVGTMVITGGRLWFEAYQAGDPYQWYIGSLDIRSRHADVTYTAVPYDPADLAASVGAPNTLVAAGYDATNNTNFLDVYRTGWNGHLTEKAQRSDWAQHLAVTRDGKYVISTQLGVLRLSDLASVRTLNTPGSQLVMVSVAPDGTIAVISDQQSNYDQKAILYRECGWTPVKVLDYGLVSNDNGVGSLSALAWSQDSDQLYDLFAAKPVGTPYLAIGVTTVRR
jgi:hypothetical protein